MSEYTLAVSVNSGLGWGKWRPLDQTTVYMWEGDPALAWYKNLVFVVWKENSGDSKLYFRIMDAQGNFQSPTVQINHVESPYMPGLAVFQNQLYLAYTDKAGYVQYAIYNDSDKNFGRVRRLDAYGSGSHDYATTLAVYSDKLYFFNNSKESSPQIHWYAIEKDGDYGSGGKIDKDGYVAEREVSALQSAEFLYIAFRGTSQRDIKWGRFNGKDWSSPTTLDSESMQTDRSVNLFTTFPETNLAIGYTNNHNKFLYTQYAQGVFGPPTTAVEDQDIWSTPVSINTGSSIVSVAVRTA